MTQPRFCPNCGASGPDCVAIGSNEGGGGYDCACKCGWTGDIWPDDEQNDFVEEAPKYCPNCAKPFPNDGIAAVPIIVQGTDAYGCSCKCGWAGIILVEAESA